MHNRSWNEIEKGLTNFRTPDLSLRDISLRGALLKKASSPRARWRFVNGQKPKRAQDEIQTVFEHLLS